CCPPMPALLTRISIRPQASTTAPIAARTSSSLLVSARSERASSPESSICAATLLAASSLMSAAMTFAPSLPKSTLIAFPMPDPAPVTSAFLPANLPSAMRPPSRRHNSAPSTLIPYRLSLTSSASSASNLVLRSSRRRPPLPCTTRACDNGPVSKLSDAIRRAGRTAPAPLGFAARAASTAAVSPTVLCIVRLNANDANKAEEAVKKGADAVIIERLLELRRFSALGRAPLLVEISGDAEASSVQVLRESGVAGFIIEASSLGKLEKLRAAIAALPARCRKPDERREAMIPAPSMAGHDHDDDDF